MCQRFQKSDQKTKLTKHYQNHHWVRKLFEVYCFSPMVLKRIKNKRMRKRKRETEKNPPIVVALVRKRFFGNGAEVENTMKKKLNNVFHKWNSISNVIFPLSALIRFFLFSFFILWIHGFMAIQYPPQPLCISRLNLYISILFHSFPFSCVFFYFFFFERS